MTAEMIAKETISEMKKWWADETLKWNDRDIKKGKAALIEKCKNYIALYTEIKDGPETIAAAAEILYNFFAK